MSPFWKNVNDELLYQGMNFKTLSYLTGIPYTTITNGKNRANSIPSADIALKISKAINKPLEILLGNSIDVPNIDSATNEKYIIQHQESLLKKWGNLITNLEKCSPVVQECFCKMIQAICEQ